jgi:anti-sigma regulatory factor (Ser/Thr protein kinase)
MFGFPHLKQVMAESSNNQGLIELLTAELETFTGPDWEQEDDVTFVVIERSPVAETGSPSDNGKTGWHTLATFNVPSKQGNERQAMEQVAAVVSDMEWASDRLEQLKTAVAEATMNAMEHGNKYQADIPVEIRVRATDKSISVMITDQGGQETTIPERTSPDLEAKLTGQQSPRGWGLFLIENMVDEMQIHNEGDYHTIELIMNIEGE